VAAALVAVPSAIAFGVAILAPLGPEYAARGAMAGLLGAVVLGIVAPTFGGAQRLITAPCAPAAAVLSALALQLTQNGVAGPRALALVGVAVLMGGAFQILFGAVGLGRLIKYMPYPVVSGYLSGVGLIIILSQLPRLLGVEGAHLMEALSSPASWSPGGIAIGTATIAAMLLGPKVTRAVPATVIGLAAGGLVYAGLALGDPALRSLAGNPLVIGPVMASQGGVLDGALTQIRGFGAVGAAELGSLLMPALTLAVLLSIDTLKTCVVVDALTRSRHDSNRELIGQGLGNVAATLMGAVPGAGTMGPTLVNVRSGASTRRSGLIEGFTALAILLALSGLLAWIPLSGLAGVLIVVGILMIDWSSFAFLRSRATVLDFVVIAAVVVVAETVSLIAASAVGIGLAILLFVREQIGGSVVRRRIEGSQRFSKQVRLPREMEVLARRGEQTVIIELQGSLFFGTADQLYATVAPELEKRTYVVLDMRRVQSVDVTAAHTLDLIEDTLAEKDGYLLFSHLPRNVPSGKDMKHYLDVVGLSQQHRIRVFAEMDGALEWIENRILDEERMERPDQKLLSLAEMDMFAGRREETLEAMQVAMEERFLPAGQKLFSSGDVGDELFLIRRGAISIMLPITEGVEHHLATFGRGDFVGEMAFLDDQPRSADAVAKVDTDLYALSREALDRFGEEHKKAAANLFEGLARTLAHRLRYADREVRAYQEG
jgi:SulP family sulfate permease